MYSKGVLFLQNRPPRLDTKRSSYQQDVSTSLPFHRASPQPHQALPVGSLCQPMPEHWIWEPQRSWKRSAEQIEQKENREFKSENKRDIRYPKRSTSPILLPDFTHTEVGLKILTATPEGRSKNQCSSCPLHFLGTGCRWPGSLQKEHETTWIIMIYHDVDDWFSMVFASNGFSGSTSQFYRAVQQSS